MRELREIERGMQKNKLSKIYKVESCVKRRSRYYNKDIYGI